MRLTFRPRERALLSVSPAPWCSGSTGGSNPPGPGSTRWWGDQYTLYIHIMTIKFKRLSEIYKTDMPYISLYNNKYTIAYNSGLVGDITPTWF